MDEYPLVPVQPTQAEEVTYSVIEPPKPRDQSPLPIINIDSDEIDIVELTATPVYQ